MIRIIDRRKAQLWRAAWMALTFMTGVTAGLVIADLRGPPGPIPDPPQPIERGVSP